MRSLLLPEYLALGNTQQKFADLVQVTQGAVHLMLKHKREIWIVLDDNNVLLKVYEVKHMYPQ